MSRLIYPKETRDCIESLAIKERHPLLQLDRCTAPVTQEQQKNALEAVVAAYQDNGLLQDLAKRRKECINVASDSIICWTQPTSSALALHLSRAGALESAGTCLHPLYGFAYIPATGLKGMARAAALDLNLPRDLVLKVFGSEPGDFKQSCGEICFHDSWPVTWPVLTLDISATHHPKYYQKEFAPVDCENPVPLSFLTVPTGTNFEFFIELRRTDPKIDRSLLSIAKECLSHALKQLGAGAKTNAGYGRFSSGISETLNIGKSRRKTHQFDLSLVTRGYLGGADWSKPAELRVPAIRGQLRWWWRAMHAGFLSVEELRNLESAIWGSTSQSSAVAMSLECEVKPEYGDKIFDQRTQSGLHYFSYGMNPDNKNPDARKWLEKGQWKLDMRFRKTTFLKANNDIIVLSEEVVKKQVLSALWMLGHYGGIGAKSRKGFGSLDIVGDFSPLVLEVSDTNPIEKSIQSHNQDLRKAIGSGFAFSTNLVESPAIFHPGTIRGEARIQVSGDLFTGAINALDQLGNHYKAFASSLKHQTKKSGLGLPRKIHGPNKNPLPHQRARIERTGEKHKPPIYLLKDGKTTADANGGGKIRYASPLHFHVSRTHDSIILRWIGIPAVSLPTLQNHATFLQEVHRHLSSLKLTFDLNKVAPNAIVNRPEIRVPQAPRQFVKVKVKLLEKKDNAGRPQYKVQESDTQVQGILFDGIPPNPLPEVTIGEVKVEIEVYKNTSANPPRYRWDEPRQEPKKNTDNNRKHRR